MSFMTEEIWQYKIDKTNKLLPIFNRDKCFLKIFIPDANNFMDDKFSDSEPEDGAEAPIHQDKMKWRQETAVVNSFSHNFAQELSK